MITDNDLYSLAIFLGSLAMLLIVLYHFLEVNAKEDDTPEGNIEGKTDGRVTGEKTSKEKADGRGKEKLVGR